MMGIISDIRSYLLLLAFIALGILITPSASTISNKRLCYDPHCEVIISEAITVTSYNSSDPEILSFQANVHVDVFSKSAGTREDLWGVKIGDQRGYAPVSLLHEKKILQRVLQHEVDTQKLNPDNGHNIEKQEKFPSPKVIHGTTLYDPEEESVQNSNYATERSIDITSSQETPILTVHPNKLSTSEVTFDNNPLTEIYDFKKDLLTTATSVLADGEQSTINGIDFEIEQSIEKAPEHPQPKKIHVQVEEQVLVTLTHIKESTNDILPAEISQPLLHEETKEISAEMIEAVPKISEGKQVENEKADGTNNDDLIFNKKTVIETTKTESSEDMVTSAFHKVTSLFSFPTTDTPQIIETDNSIDNNIITKNKIETESVTEINIPETLEDNTQKDILFPLNTTKELQINEVIDTVDSNEGSNQEVTTKQESNFDEVARNINLLDVIGFDQNQYVAVAEKKIEMSTKSSIVIPVTTLEPKNIVKKPVQIDHLAVEFKNERPEELDTEISHQEFKIDVVNATLPSLPITLKTQSMIPEVKLEETTNQVYSHLPKHLHPELLSELDTKTEESKNNGESAFDNNTEVIGSVKFDKNYWETLSYVCLTAFTTLLFSLGYYYIENTRRDGQLIAKINQLKQKLLVTSKEYSDLDENFKLATTKLISIEDESFGSNEMVASLKTELEFAHKSQAELEDQVASLEKDLEGATEAGLELERMLREILASNNTENPLAKSVEDLQNRLNVQQGVNQSLTNSLQLKTEENEALSKDLSLALERCEQFEVELTRFRDELKIEKEAKQNIEETFSLKNSSLEKKLTAIGAEKITLKTQLKGKELELKDLLTVVKKLNTSNIDFTKLYDVSRVKAEAGQLLEERDELKIRLSEVEGAHQILEEHMKVINKEIGSLRDQCKLAEKLKSDAETKLDVLSKFFEEKEAERQKEETLWLQQQGEVSSTVNRMQTMQDEIQNYRQQIETLKHEILDQEREYKSQITNLEAKSHDQWVLTRQNERRLEESKAESAQLRNRLTMMEKNFNDSDSDVRMHRLETNGETTSPLYIGVNPSSSPIMFSGAGNIPPPPPYFMGPPLPPFMPLPLPSGSTSFDVGQRPPPLGGRLSSPPPMPPLYSPPGRYNNHGTPPPPLSPSSADFIPPPIRGNHSSSAFAHDRNSPPHFQSPPWGDDTLAPSRNNSGFHSSHRDQRNRDRRGSLHSSGESFDKSQRRGNIKDLL